MRWRDDEGGTHGAPSPAVAAGAGSLTAALKAAESGETQPGDVEAQAVRALQDRMVAYVIKTVVRVTVRLILEREMQQKMRKEHGDAGTLLAFAASSAVNLALEQADLRAWSMLPSRMAL